MTAPQPSRADDGAGVEALERVFRSVAWIDAAVDPPEWAAFESDVVTAVLASDWLAARDAAIRAEALAPVLALAEGWEASFTEAAAKWDEFGHPGGMTRFLTLDRAAAELRAAAASPEAGQEEGGTPECDHPGLDHGPMSYTWPCPKCGVCKFIGHGPLCGDCYAAAGQA